MKLKNYQEDIVLRAIEIALEDRPELSANEEFVNDVAAYALNRLPPRYVMSERGFVRMAMEHLSDEPDGKSLANIIELMILVNRGVDLVQKRRPVRGNGVPGHTVAVPDSVEYVHNFPQIVGRVKDSQTGESVLDAIVTLMLDGDKVAPADAGWENPYVTRQQTGGYFSFWPHPLKSSDESLGSVATLTVEHPDYEAFSFETTMPTEGDFDRIQTIRGDQIVNLSAFLLNRKG